MDNRIRVIVLGTGRMGAGIGRLVLEKQGLELVGAYGRRAQRAGMDLGRAMGLERNLNMELSGDLAALIEQTRPRIAIQATCSKITDAREEIVTLIRHGVHVISIAEEMAYPCCRSPSFAEKIHELAIAHDVGILGTGINPGFILDLLIITLTGVCSDIQSISATRVNDLSPYGPSVLASQGVGLKREDFMKGLKNGTVAGHFGFPESIHMIADVLGWHIERIEESREPIISRIRRETPFVTVEPGQVAGCFHKAVAYRQDKPVISLIHPQQIHPQLEEVKTGDSIEINGTPNVHLRGSPEIPGGPATCGLAVNMIPRLLNAAPGLHCMADLPVPAAIMGDVRSLIHKKLCLPTNFSHN
ncbi:MAG: 2,4-diaminopentanoate dehydrogenase [Thermodesulfobacteriota bacterium]|nr:2,4-diaminopentanoate dehydrogenase [Thermodesulfobacteriota bacterium]